VETVLSLLAPFAPFICEELWQALGNEESIHLRQWPSFDEELARPEEITLVVQVNGKVRDRLLVPFDMGPDEMEQRALACENVQRFIGDRQIKKVIVVPGKLVNIVL
jgi:leucyl-tRNA synthetase